MDWQRVLISTSHGLMIQVIGDCVVILFPMKKGYGGRRFKLKPLVHIRIGEGSAPPSEGLRKQDVEVRGAGPAGRVGALDTELEALVAAMPPPLAPDVLPVTATLTKMTCPVPVAIAPPSEVA